MDFLATIVAFLKEHAVVLGAAAAVLAIVETVFAPFRTIMRRWKKPEVVEIANPEVLVQQPSGGLNPKLTVPEYLNIQRQIKADLLQELETAHPEEKEKLRDQIAALEKRIGNPEAAFKEQQTRIADLEALLERSGNDIGGDRIIEALECGDFSIADEIFVEIEARREMDVQEAARAASGRGEIAEEQVRWADAAEHYSRAARLDPRYETLIRAGVFLSRAGRQAEAFRHNEQLVAFAKTEFGSEHEKTGTAINNLAIGYYDTGRYNEAEPLFREALVVIEAALGMEHPNTHLVRENLENFLTSRPN